MTIRPALSPPGAPPHRSRLVEALLSICAGAATLVACGDSGNQSRDEFFTIQLVPGTEPPGPNAGTYYYIPVTGTSYHADPRFAPCGVVQVSFSGIALASAGGEGSRVPDDAEQESGTSARYVGNADYSTCSTMDGTFQAEFTYRGARYIVEGGVVLPFGNYSAIVPGTNWADTCSQYAFSLNEVETTSGSVACFWPYEFGPPASATYAMAH